MEPSRQSKRLSVAHLRLLVAVLLQNEDVFREFQGKLTVQHFSDESFQLLYRTVSDYFTDNQELPSVSELEADVAAHFEADPNIISEAGRDDLEEFIAYAFDPDTFSDLPPTSPKLTKFAFQAAKRLLQQRHASLVVETLQSVNDFDLVSSVLQQAHNQAEVLQLESHQIKRSYLFTEDWDTQDPLIIHSTGLGFFDKYMAGGAAKGEAYGLMAPYGTCKTTLAVMLWCTAARHAYQETLLDDWNGRKGMTVLVSYEAAASPEIQHRSLMYAAQVSRNSLQTMGKDGLAALQNDPENPLPYEKKKFSRQISDGLFEPERVRIDKAIPTLNEYTLCLDLSGSDPEFPTAGNGGIQEIISRIKLELRNRGADWYVKNVIIDYLGLMVDQDSTIRISGGDAVEDHKAYQAAVGRIVHEISKPFKCHTWILHQLSGAANAVQSIAKKLHHTDAKGSKSFGENLDFAFVIGNLNLDSMGQMACTKHRRAKKAPPSVVKVDGEFNNVFAPDNYHVDNKGNIVDKSTISAAGVSVDANDEFLNEIEVNTELLNEINMTEESDEGDDG